MLSGLGDGSRLSRHGVTLAAMRSRGWFWSFVCVLAATALACSDDGAPDAETVEQPASQVSDQTQPEPSPTPA